MKLKALSAMLFAINITLTGNSQTNDLIKSIQQKLVSGQTSISDILSDTSLMWLHSSTEFRMIIKQNASTAKLRLTSLTEPGTEITVKGTVAETSGSILANKLVYVYQTSSQGWYSDTAPHILKNEGDRKHARLFGYFKTGTDGKFEFTTIKPQGYPHSTLPAHIHIEIMIDTNQNFISELLFDDDPRLIGEIRARSIKENFLISKNTGTKDNPVYAYQIIIPH